MLSFLRLIFSFGMSVQVVGLLPVGWWHSSQAKAEPGGPVQQSFRYRMYRYFLRNNAVCDAISWACVLNLLHLASVCAVIFLLSSKAGGVGLNLIGANRLILFDPDWYSEITTIPFSESQEPDYCSLISSY